jgi:hypothetical protein
MIGQDIEHVQLKQMQEAADVHSAVPGQTMREIIEEADANLQVVIKDLRYVTKIAEESGDPGSVDLFSKIVQFNSQSGMGADGKSLLVKALRQIIAFQRQISYSECGPQ